MDIRTGDDRNTQDFKQEPMKLPLFISKENRYAMAFFCAILIALGYFGPNHYHWTTPQLLPLSQWDKSIPLVPWTIFIYTSEYFLFISAYFFLKEEINRNRYIWTFFGTLLFSMLFFIFTPIAYPRADFPLPTDTHWFIYQYFSMLRAIDDPSNAFPSLHVSCCYVAAFSFLPSTESRKRFWMHLIWATAVMFSTLTTKQHYIVDVIAGFLLATVAYWFFFKKVRYVPLSKYFSKLANSSF